MARVEVVMPQMGESITTGTITKWNKDVGDTIEIDEILLEISTDKVESEIPSPVEGKIAELLFPEGETIDVGVVIAIIEDDMDADISSSSSSDKKETKKEETTDTSATPENKDQSTESSESLEATSGKRRFYTPLVRKMAKDNGVALSELENIKGSGAGGRVNKEDFEKFLEQRGSQGTQKHKRS